MLGAGRSSKETYTCTADEAGGTRNNADRVFLREREQIRTHERRRHY
jgi:hypothetical protein